MDDKERLLLWVTFTTIYGGCLWWLWKYTQKTHTSMRMEYNELLQQYRDLQDEHIALLLEQARDREDATTILTEAEEHED